MQENCSSLLLVNVQVPYYRISTEQRPIGGEKMTSKSYRRGKITVKTSSFSPNSTSAATDDHEGLSQLYVILKTPFFSFVIVVGQTGNSLIVATLSCCREMRTPCTLVIASICAADLGVCLPAAPLRIIEIYYTAVGSSVTYCAIS